MFLFALNAAFVSIMLRTMWLDYRFREVNHRYFMSIIALFLVQMIFGYVSVDYALASLALGVLVFGSGWCANRWYGMGGADVLICSATVLYLGTKGFLIYLIGISVMTLILCGLNLYAGMLHPDHVEKSSDDIGGLEKSFWKNIASNELPLLLSLNAAAIAAILLM